VSLLRKRLSILILGFLALLIGVAVMAYIIPFKGFGVSQKPEQHYEYYYIYAEEDGRELMRVPIAINVGDELITEDNKRYKVVKVEGDKGIATYVETVSLEEYRPKE
jgi:stage II sporulation protein P